MVNANQTKFFRKAALPFKIVQQRPNVQSRQIAAVRQRPFCLSKGTAQQIDPIIVDDGFSIHVVIAESPAYLRYKNRRILIVIPQLRQHLI